MSRTMYVFHVTLEEVTLEKAAPVMCDKVAGQLAVIMHLILIHSNVSLTVIGCLWSIALLSHHFYSVSPSHLKVS
jgi:hypothetical protein